MQHLSINSVRWIPVSTLPRPACSLSRCARPSCPTTSPTPRPRGTRPTRPSSRASARCCCPTPSTGQQVGTINTGVRIDKVVTDTTPSTLNQTGQPLDFGIAGTGYFAVRTGSGISYTRDGQFQSNSPQPARRRPGQSRARPERPAHHGEQDGHRPGLRPRRLQRAQRHQAGHQLLLRSLHRQGRRRRPPGRARGLRRGPGPDHDRHDRLAARLPGRAERASVDRPDDAGRRAERRSIQG